MGKGMQLVQPIREKSKIENMKRYLKERNMRDWLLFVLGINSGLRIGDLLRLSVEDVQNQDHVEIRERKTGKLKRFKLGEKTQKAIREYIKSTCLNSGPLFPSAKGAGKPISGVQAWRILSTAATAVGIKEAIGTHSLRKTFGYHSYKSGCDIYLIQNALNHSHPAVTRRYIGLTQDELDEVYANLDL